MPNQERIQPTAEQLRKMFEMREQVIPKTRIAHAIGHAERTVFRWFDEYDKEIMPKGCSRYGKKAAREHAGIYFDVTCMVDVLKGENHEKA